MKNKDDPQIKARRIMDHYAPIEQELIQEWESEGFPGEKTKRITDVQRRRAKAARVLNIGLYGTYQ